MDDLWRALTGRPARVKFPLTGSDSGGAEGQAVLQCTGTVCAVSASGLEIELHDQVPLEASSLATVEVLHHEGLYRVICSPHIAPGRRRVVVRGLARSDWQFVERRQHGRVAVHLAAQLRVAGSNYDVGVTDLSLGGVGLTCWDPFMPGQAVQLRFGRNSGLPETLVKGRVVRISQGQNGVWHVGILFLDLPEDLQAEIERVTIERNRQSEKGA